MQKYIPYFLQIDYNILDSFFSVLGGGSGGGCFLKTSIRQEFIFVSAFTTREMKKKKHA